MAGIWLEQTDLTNVLSVATFAAIFDDASTGVTNLDIVASVIERAEQEVMSWLIGQYGQAVQSDPGLGADLFLKGCALEFAIVFAFDRYPEYVRANGKEREARYARAEERMTRVLQSRQRPTALKNLPANVGGSTVASGPRMVIDGTDGTYNGGDYVVIASGPFEAWHR